MSYFRSTALNFGGDYTYEIKRGQDIIIFTPANKNREIQDRIYLLNNPVLKSIETKNQQYYSDIGMKRNGNSNGKKRKSNGNGNGNNSRKKQNGINGFTGGLQRRKTKNKKQKMKNNK